MSNQNSNNDDKNKKHSLRRRVPILKLRSTGKDVTMLQNKLNTSGAKLKVDGKFGPLTDKTVRGFQKANSLKIDGLVGPKTRHILKMDLKKRDQIKIPTRKIYFSRKKDYPKLIPCVEILPETVPADGTSTTKITIKMKDKSGNFITSPHEQTVKLTTTCGTIEDSVKIPPNTQFGTATITSEQTSGTATVTASIGSVEGKGTVVFLDVLDDIDVEISPDTILADGKETAEVTIKMKDKSGKYITFPYEQTVKLTTTCGTIEDSVKIPPNTKFGTATITSEQTSGTATVTASIGSVEGKGTVVFLDVLDDIDVEISPDTILADGKETAEVTIKMKDKSGKYITFPYEQTVKLTTTCGTIEDSVKIPPNTKFGTATITSEQTSGTATVTASIGSVEGKGTVVFLDVLDDIDVEISPDTILADGKETAEVTIKMKDKSGKYITFPYEQTVKLTTTCGTIEDSVKIPPNTKFGTATITSEQTSGTATVTASIGSVEGKGTVVFLDVLDDIDVEISPDTILADGKETAEVTIKMKDKSGNSITSPHEQTVGLITTSGTIEDSVKIPQNAEFSTATITSGQTSDIATVTASIGSVEGTGTVMFIHGIDVEISPDTIPADGKETAVVTIKMKDDLGNSITSPHEQTVGLITTSGTIEDSVKIPQNAEFGTATITSGQTSDIATVTASIGSVEGTGTVMFIHGIDVEISPDTIPADGKETATVTIRMKDDSGNSITSPHEQTVGLITTSGTIEDSVKIPQNAEFGTATITSGQTSGIATVTASIGSINGEGSVKFTGKYCMSCGIPMNLKAQECPICENTPPSGGTDTKECNNCRIVLPQSAKFCNKCGARQPE